MSSETIIIPFRSLRDGKSRLSPVLNQLDRTELNHRMLSGVVTAALAVRSAPTVIVITPDSQAVGLLEVEFEGRLVLLEQSPARPGLNPALSQATTYGISHGARTIVVIPADLPLLQASDIENLLRRDAPVVVAPDRHRSGTNGLMQRIDATHGSFVYHFGQNSFELHLDEAHRLGLDAATAVAMGISFDLDTPSDLSDLRFFDSRDRIEERDTVASR